MHHELCVGNEPTNGLDPVDIQDLRTLGKDGHDVRCACGADEALALHLEYYVEGAPITLTKTEFDVCEFLARHSGQVFSRDQIAEAVFGWGMEYDTATISVHVSNARAKLKAVGVEPV